MTKPTEPDDLEKYAAASQTKVYKSQADLNPKDHVHEEMQAWCVQHGGIVVLNSGLILASDPTSRDVQNCKTILINKGIHPGKVVAAHAELIGMLLANVVPEESDREQRFAVREASAQQKNLRTLVREAIRESASDIHLEVREAITRIRFRRHGEMYLHAEWTATLGRQIASVAFNKETDHATEHFNPMIPQNASMPLRIDGTEVRIRLASLPAHGGFDMVMRILTVGDEHIDSLETLGYTSAQINIIQRAVQMPHGAVLLAGPTGSGKTTTLAACIQLIDVSRKVYTIEDPVEKVIPQVTQIPVNSEKDDRSFANFGKACLRMDPDYIVLGEMRDLDTANVMVRASITGHLVFSTVHTNSATNIVTRLVDMGISPILLGDTNLLVTLICQRLIGVLCKRCAVPVVELDSHQAALLRWKSVFADALPSVRGRGKGCKYCNGIGIAGRTVVAEVVWIDEMGRQFIQKQDTFGWEKYLREHGWNDYKQHAIQLVKQGRVDPFDAERITGEINSTFSKESFSYGEV